MIWEEEEEKRKYRQVFHSIDQLDARAWRRAMKILKVKQEDEEIGNNR